MRRLIITNTYYQLITAIQLKNVLFSADEVVLLISNQSNGAERVADCIKEAGIFEEVYFTRNKGVLDNRSKAVKILDGIRIGFGIGNTFSFLLKDFTNLFFDEIIAYNMGVDVYSIYALLYRHNPELAVSMLEEGILSYRVRRPGNKNWNYINRLRKVLGKKCFPDEVRRFYCFYPSVYQGNLEVVPIPRIQLECATVQQLKAIFEIDKRELNYSYRYIFFTSVYDFEGGEPIGEFELACRIAELVGKDNLLIKQHPRDTRSIYADHGFHVDRNSSIPWEVIQVSANFSNVTYLTVNSGSVLSGSTLSESPIRTFYLYPLCDYSGNAACQNSARVIEDVLGNQEMQRILKEVHIAAKAEDIL